MANDPIETAGLVAREVRSGRRDGAETKIAIARRTYPTGQGDLWDAIANADRIHRWFLPISGDLREGGHFQLEGNAGGTIERCRAPDSFNVTWEYGPMTSWLAVTLRPNAAGTTLELVHEAHVDPDLWGQFGPGAVGLGWDLGLYGLGLHLETRAAVDPAHAAAFPSSPEGIALIEAAAAGWAEAAIAAGEERDAAQAAAQRVQAMYTAPPGE